MFYNQRENTIPSCTRLLGTSRLLRILALESGSVSCTRSQVSTDAREYLG